MIMMNVFKRWLKRMFTPNQCICKYCKHKVKVANERYICLMNNVLVSDYGKCCEKYS